MADPHSTPPGATTDGGRGDGLLLPGELGLLTIASRRGQLVLRDGPAGSITGRKRQVMLERLVAAGLLADDGDGGNPAARTLRLTEDGRRALAAADAWAPPRRGRRAGR